MGDKSALGLKYSFPLGRCRSPKHTLKENTWETINNDALPGADETYARTLPIHKRQLQLRSTKWVKSGD